MDVDVLLNECLLEPLTDADYKKELRALAKGFTVNREHIAEYGTSSKTISAYASFYLPTNMKKLPFIFSQLDSLPFDENKPLEVIDFGCGPGTYSFAFYEQFPSLQCTYHLVDTKELMLKQAQKIQQHIYPKMNAHYQSRIPQRKKEMRILILGNVLNEMTFSGFEKFFKLFDADAFIFIEPGTKDSFLHMQNVRTFMMSKGYAIQYPCPSQRDCPAKNNELEWCHQVLKTSIEPEVSRLGQLAKLDRFSMPFIGHVYSKEAAPDKQAVLFHLQSNSKHAFYWQVCQQREHDLTLTKIEISKKSLSKQIQKQFDKTSSGRFLTYTPAKTLKNGTVRAKDVVLK